MSVLKSLAVLPKRVTS